MARTLALFAVLVSGCACSSEPTTFDGGGGADASGFDAALDAAPSSDAGDITDASGAQDAAIDAPIDAGVDAATDSGLSCNGVEGTMPMGICDGRGIVGCRMWAEANADAPGSAFAVCIQSGTGGCARADSCTDASDVSTCTCGGGPACDPLQVCASDSPDGTPRCRCITPAAS